MAYDDHGNARLIRLVESFPILRDLVETSLKSTRRMAHINVIFVVACALADADNRVLTCDLTKEYVAINGDCRS
jgi:N-acetylglutamate synthase/N-acetylornithine aminotransferase